MKKQLVEEEHQQVQAGSLLSNDMSPSAFVVEGLAIEEAQYVTITAMVWHLIQLGSGVH